MELGWDPPSFGLPLAAGGTYACALQSSTAWPAGLVIDLYFEGTGSPVTWQATIDGTQALWTKTVAQVASILNSELRTVSIRGTPSGGEPAIWYRGTVRVV